MKATIHFALCVAIATLADSSKYLKEEEPQLKLDNSQKGILKPSGGVIKDDKPALSSINGEETIVLNGIPTENTIHLKIAEGIAGGRPENTHKDHKGSESDRSLAQVRENEDEDEDETRYIITEGKENEHTKEEKNKPYKGHDPKKIHDVVHQVGKIWDSFDGEKKQKDNNRQEKGFGSEKEDSTNQDRKRNYDSQQDKVFGYEKEQGLKQDKRDAEKYRDLTKKFKNKIYNKKRLHQKENDELKTKFSDEEVENDAGEQPDGATDPVAGSGSLHINKELYEIDPVLNILRARRDAGGSGSQESVATSSSSRELGNFKDQWKDLWMQKKFEAMNASIPVGDTVNMAAARPWGQKCGDPGQHDMPWGTCMLASECEPEYRIYRGDLYCGRTMFTCCALELTTYDLYSGFEVSFEGKSLSTDTEEIKREAAHGEMKKKKKRKRRREDRIKKIKKVIKRIVNEIQKILNKLYRNSTRLKKKKTKQLKQFLSYLKKEYRKNRLAVKDLHQQTMVKIDNALMKKLNDIKNMNENFVKNQTFADIVVNGTMTKQGARMLIQAYPELAEFIELDDPKTERRSMGSSFDPKAKRSDYLEYDIEYGFLYY